MKPMQTSKSKLAFGIIVGFFAPGRWLARRYLPRSLMLNGLDYTRIPTPCLNELADRTYFFVENLYSRRNRVLRRAELHEFLDLTAAHLAHILDPRIPITSAEEDWLLEPTRQILARHGVFFPEPP